MIVCGLGNGHEIISFFGNFLPAACQKPATASKTAWTCGLPFATTPSDGDSLIVYDATQHIPGVRNALSRVLQMPLDKIRVITHFVGGAFGAKCYTWPHTMIAAAAARHSMFR